MNWYDARNAAEAAAVRKKIEVLAIDGDTADKIGHEALASIAVRRQTPVIVEGESRYHTGKLFLPVRDCGHIAPEESAGG